MRLYWEFIKNTFQSQLAYRANTILALVGQIVTVLISISIWRVLLHEGSAAAGTRLISFEDMVVYTVVANALGLFTTNDVIWILDWKIQTGEIAMDLTKPVDLRAQLLARTVGGLGSSAITELIPFIIFTTLVFGMKLPSVDNLLLFAIAAFNGMLINFFISYLFGLIGFWWQRVRQFFTVHRVLLRLFAGSFVPLWFFPQGLIEVANFLPFRFVYYIPTAIFMGKISQAEALYQIMLELIWLGAFCILERIVWTRAIRRLVVQGG